MFKQGILNYFYNLKHFFTPLGVLFLGILLACSIFIPSLISTLKSLINNINLINETEITFNLFLDELINSLIVLDWKDSSSFNNLANANWLKEIIINSIKITIPEINSATDVLINNSIKDISNLLFGSVIFIFLGLIGGYFLTKYFIRKNMAKRALWKFFLISLIDSILSATLIAICLTLLYYWVPSIIFLTFLSLLLFGTVSLFEAYLVHGYKKIKLKTILTFKNIIIILLINTSIFLIATILVSMMTMLINGVIGFCIALPLLEIAFIVISLNAEAFVKSNVENTAL